MCVYIYIHTYERYMCVHTYICTQRSYEHHIKKQETVWKQEHSQYRNIASTYIFQYKCWALVCKLHHTHSRGIFYLAVESLQDLYGAK
jgi:hypothetical protein